MSNIKLALANLGEDATEELVKVKNPNGLDENKKTAKRGGSIAKVARDELEKDLKKSVVTSDNYLDYQYNDKKLVDKIIFILCKIYIYTTNKCPILELHSNFYKIVC